jgi:hypothetical protein
MTEAYQSWIQANVPPSPACHDKLMAGAQKPKCDRKREDGSPCEGFVPCPRHFREQNMADYLEKR